MKAHDGVHSFALSSPSDGRLIIDDVKIGDKQFSFLIDSAATRSAIFENALNRTPLQAEYDERVNVHGMVDTDNRGLVLVPELSVGELKFGPRKMVILSDQVLGRSQRQRIDGLIGMDILENYRIFVDYADNQLSFIPNELPPVRLPHSWKKLTLNTNPVKESGHPLHFVSVDIAGRKTPMLFDTGSVFSAMNWRAARFAEMKWEKRRLRKQWEIAGAVGQFSPKTLINMTYLQGGKKKWYDKKFIVMDFNNAEEMGLKDEAMALGGMNLYKEGNFFIDFDAGIVAFQPRDREFQRYSNGNKVRVGSGKINGKRS